MHTETVPKAGMSVAFSVSVSYCSITSSSHAVTHPFRTVPGGAMFFLLRSSALSVSRLLRQSCTSVAVWPDCKQKTDTSLYPFLVCVAFLYFTLVLSFPLCQFLHFSCTFQYFSRNICASQHTRQLLYRGFLIQRGDSCFHRISIRFFLYQIMEI